MFLGVCESRMSIPGSDDKASTAGLRSRRTTQIIVWLGAVLVALCATPLAAAHGASGTHVYAGGVHLEQWHALCVIGLGLGMAAVSAYLPRVLKPAYSHYALWSVFAGLVLAAVGGVLFTQLATATEYTASSIPFPRTWYEPIALLLGSVVMTGSLLLGRLQWPTRPEYSILGIELGLWIAYPALVGMGEYTNPLGYVLVLSVPVTVGYILWQDCAGAIRSVLQDRTARRFGGGVALTAGLFFMFAAGFFSFVPEEGLNAPQTATVTTLPTLFPLVTWPTLEWFFPTIPFVGMLSVGVLVVVGTLGGLIGLNAAIIARLWTSGEQTEVTESTVGTAAFIGANACSCCGPIIGQFVILVAGSSAAAPIYWLFVDLASPAGTLFLVTSIALLTGSLLHAATSLIDSPACEINESPSASSVQAD